MVYMKLPYISKNTRILLVVTTLVSLSTFTIAYFYYRAINNSEDPRIVETRFMLMRYDNLLQSKAYQQADATLDSIGQLFDRVPGYSDSFEPGIVFNNKATILISRALYSHDDDSLKAMDLVMAAAWTDSCINHYINWLDEFGKLDPAEIKTRILPAFQPADKAFAGKNIDKIIEKRVKDIVEAQTETPRRLSVAYTNKGVIERHQGLPNAAIESYTRALELWRDNPSALSNLNVLMGKPPKDRSFIEKLFPPQRIP